MSELYEIKLRIEEKIRADGLDANEIKGRIGLRTGKLFAFINAATPDDPATVAKFKKAAKEVLNLDL